MKNSNKIAFCLAVLAVFSIYSNLVFANSTPELSKAIEKLAADSGGTTRVITSRATGVARLIQFPAGSIELKGPMMEMRAISFFDSYGRAFGIDDPTRELKKSTSRTDSLGMTHISYHQIYEGVPVFATQLRTHFSPFEELISINGTFVPNLTIDPTPSLGAARAAEIARFLVAKDNGLLPVDMQTAAPVLYVYRSGLARNIPGDNSLVWEVEVFHELAVREFLYIDAHEGTLVDRIQGVLDLNRRIHHQSFPNLIWREGDALPFSGINESKDAEINGLIEFTKQTYEFFSHLSDGTFLSYNSNDISMQAVYASDQLECPNARWNGRTTEFCEGIAVDDVVAHEWTHAYSRFTHSLIYQSQPGALNEAFSDIFGETVDLLNGEEIGMPVPTRSQGACSTFGGLPSASFEILAPPSVSGHYSIGRASFNPLPPWDVSAHVELVDDGVEDGDNTRSDGCDSPFEGFTPGRIAMIDRGNCLFQEKAVNATNAGAVAVIVVNNQGDDVITMGGGLPLTEIPSLLVGQSDGEALKAVLDQGVVARLGQGSSVDQSARWLVSDDSSDGAFRDMWNPTCFSDPSRVSDERYYCGGEDNGGVHINSGIPNHAYALLVDGGTFNQRSIGAIGLTKAAHIYWRAMSTYQVPVSSFADHADLLEISCTDLVGASLRDLDNGGPSLEVINSNDCAQVAEAMLAVEMRDQPFQCEFEPVLAANPPSVSSTRVVYIERFESPPNPSWTVSSEGVYTEFDGRVWELKNDLPAGREGAAFYAVNGAFIGNCITGNDDQSGVMHLDSPSLQIPSTATGTLLVFDHYVATEVGWDGGNIKISVNGGTYQLVPAEAFLFNSYNGGIIIENEDGPNANPLAGEPGFTGVDGGLLTGSWGQSHIDLEALANPGDSIQIRFDFGSDGCSGYDGWYVDNLKVLTDGGAAIRTAGDRRRP